MRHYLNVPCLSVVFESRKQRFMDKLIDLYHFSPILRSLYWSFYAALLPRRGPHILRRTLSVCPSVCPSVRPSRYCFCLLYSRTVLRANIQNRKTCFRLWASVTYVLFGTHRWPHIVRLSRPHKFLFSLFFYCFYCVYCVYACVCVYDCLSAVDE